jgi:quercetin dioxygenase-like cupin family protein
MSLFVTTLSGGYASPSHQHSGAVFTFVLEGEIESQVEPDAPKIYHAGDFFHESPGQVHRVFRNRSATTPAKFLIFTNNPPNTGAPDTGTVAVRLLLQERLTALTNQEVSVVKITTAPGGAATGAHQHPGPVFAYLLKGEVESQVDPGESKVYRAGDVFYEPPMHTHRLYRNLSKTEAAELLVFQVHETGKPFAIRAN